jgi:CelD/BcsL family acetyltransferase involved in cellulose biosynthesis
VDVRLTEGEAAFDLPEWRDLLAADRHRHIFVTPQWCRVWWEEFGTGCRLLVLTFLDPHPVGLAALVLDPAADGEPPRLSLLGGEDLTDYMGPLSAGDGHLPGIAEAMVRYASEEIRGWSCLDVRCLPVPFGFAEWLVEAADRMGLDFRLDQHEMTLVLDLPASFDAYLERLDRKARHELRRKLRRFDREAGPARLRSSDPSSLEPDLESFIDLHRGSEGLKGKFLVPERASFFRRIAHSLQPEGLLSLDFLETEDLQAASTFSFIFDDVFSLYNSAYDDAVRALSPGVVLVARLIERGIERGLRRFDFLRGTERYKFDLGAQPLPLHSVQIRRLS